MHDLALYCLVVLVTCVTPGAGVIYTVTSALRGGMRTALCAPLGNLAGVTAVSALSATGLGALLAASVLWNIALG